MQRIRLWAAGLVAWLLLLFNIERAYEPLNIASFVYVMASIVLGISILLTQLRNFTFTQLCVGLLAVFLIMKWALGYHVFGMALPLTVTESCVLLISLWLGGRIGTAIASFESSVEELSLVQAIQGLKSAKATDQDFYREVRRARQFGRELGVLSVAPEQKELTKSLNEFLREIQRRTVRKYAHARLAEVLISHVQDSDLVSIHDDHFLILVPEGTPDRLKSLTQILTAACRRELGFGLRIGSAFFPDEEVTLAGLVDRAVSEMESRERPSETASRDPSQASRRSSHVETNITTEA